MHPKMHDKRILAIALRSRRLGFAVFEGPKRLLDWGMVFYPLNNVAQHAAASKRVATLLTLFAPSVIAVRRTRSLNVRIGSGVRPILRLIRREASSRLIPVRLMRAAAVRKVFGQPRTKSKHEIAAMITQMYPELLWKLPPKRKIWESEHPIMTMFDAVALGFAYWQRDGERDPTPE
jgi:hypothetical protein